MAQHLTSVHGTSCVRGTSCAPWRSGPSFRLTVAILTMAAGLHPGTTHHSSLTTHHSPLTPHHSPWQRAFIPALLRDAATLTPDPARADLFVVPAAATNMEELGAYYPHLLRHIRQRWPYWNASRGANHVWMCSGDHGGGVLAGTEGVREGLGLAHYFKGERALLRRGVAGMRPSHLVYAPLLRGATAVARRAYAGFGRRGWHVAEEARRRDIHLFFAGHLALHDLFHSPLAPYSPLQPLTAPYSPLQPRTICRQLRA